MTFIVLTVLAISAIWLVVGLGRVVAEAFHEHIVWGIAVLCVPGALVIFVLTHWAMCLRGTKPAVISAVVLGLTWTYGMPMVRANGDELRMRKAFHWLEDARKPASYCPEPEHHEPGWATYCCTPTGWTVQDTPGCSAVYVPTETCGPAKVGQSRRTVCGTIGPKLQKKKPD